MVSWKLAAEMKLSVESEAFVMPKRTGWATAGFLPFVDLGAGFASIAQRGSEELAVMSTVMQSYTSRPFAECRVKTSPT